VALRLNGSEFSQAYRCFFNDPAAGIHHIIAAGRGSRWENWVNARLARQAIALQETNLTINLADLLQLPENTLGGAYARHMIRQGFDPQEFVTDDLQETWVNRRAAIAHDVHHLITGFDATPVGEYGLAAFSLVQYWNLLNVFVLSFLPLSVLSDLKTAPRLLAATLKGFWMGLICRPIFAYPFEANWSKSLVEVRQELRINV
jgi:ubiquinone biosynthesis protein Coq4